MTGIEMIPALIEWLIIATLVIIPAWRILRKAGLIPALSLLLIVPLLGWFCVMAVLAFAPWPALKRATHADLASTFE
jgi:hypothetical protein